MCLVSEYIIFLIQYCNQELTVSELYAYYHDKNYSKYIYIKSTNKE
jgi:hypothetical protein